MAEKNDKPKKDNAPKRVQLRRPEAVARLKPLKVPGPFQGFVDFVREQGVMGLAIGLVLGVAAKSVVDSLVNNIFNPVFGVMTGGRDFSDKFICIKSAGDSCVSKVGYGQFLSDIFGFLIVAASVYLVFKVLKLENLDKKKS